ncbi:MAG: asparagine synthase (glutamine-hydrolyzing) [Gammaproteobacteria bacterium]|nr:asparagine synthase (glutamine-hydrolyzing) [Gammaproteobacteria bacterium]
MCGIVGIVSPAPDTTEQETMAARMAELLQHRGPDAQGLTRGAHVVLAHRRLAVVDLTDAANQPFTDVDNRYWIVYDGQLYNYRTLRDELRHAGYEFRTESDTEVVMAAYQIWGKDCVTRLNGMFAFAIWDNATRGLFLARDRLGEKPLFYATTNDGTFLFASEPCALSHHPDVGRSMSMKGLSEFLLLNYTIGRQTLNEGIYRFPAAHRGTLHFGQPLKLEPYWDLTESLRNKNSFPSLDAAAAELLELLDDSVRRRLVSDVPIGAFLSGGISSGAIVASMARCIGNEQTHAFSIGNDPENKLGLEQARRTANQLGVVHHGNQATSNPSELIGYLTQAAREPIADVSFSSITQLAQTARQEISVALTGDGANEVLLGCNTYLADKLQRFTSPPFRTIAKAFPRRRFLQRLTNKALPTTLATLFKKRGFGNRTRQYVGALSLSGAHAHFHWRQVFSELTLDKILSPEILCELDLRAAFDEFETHYARVQDCHYLDQNSYVDIKTRLVDNTLVKLDRSTMAHSLEARAPFLDHRLVEFIAALPVKFKLHGSNGKYLLKHSQRTRLSEATLAHRRRRSSGVNWFNGALGEFVDDMLHTQAIGHITQVDGVDTLLAEHRAKRQDHGPKIISLVSLSLWLSTNGECGSLRG